MNILTQKTSNFLSVFKNKQLDETQAQILEINKVIEGFGMEKSMRYLINLEIQKLKELEPELGEKEAELKAKHQVVDMIKSDAKINGFAEEDINISVNNVVIDTKNTARNKNYEKIKTLKKHALYNPEYYFDDNQRYDSLPAQERAVIEERLKNHVNQEIKLIELSKNVGYEQALELVIENMHAKAAKTRENISLIFDKAAEGEVKRRGALPAWNGLLKDLSKFKVSKYHRGNPDFDKVKDIFHYAESHKKMLMKELFRRYAGKTVEGIEYGDIHDVSERLARSKEIVVPLKYYKHNDTLADAVERSKAWESKAWKGNYAGEYTPGS